MTYLVNGRKEPSMIGYSDFAASPFRYGIKMQQTISYNGRPHTNFYIIIDRFSQTDEQLWKSCCIEYLILFHRRILIDTGDKGYPEYLTNLKTVLQNHNTTIQEIILTHHHADHIGGVQEICHDVIDGKCDTCQLSMTRGIQHFSELLD